jgi:hypothetical protein
MINIAEKYVVRADHISGVSQFRSLAAQPQMKEFDVYLVGGQTLLVKTTAEAADTARRQIIEAVNVPL